jgi:hypothetical protein
MAKTVLYQDELIQISKGESRNYSLIINKNEFQIDYSQFTELIKTPLSKIEGILDSINPQIRCRLKEQSLIPSQLGYAFLRARVREKSIEDRLYSR